MEQSTPFPNVTTTSEQPRTDPGSTGLIIGLVIGIILIIVIIVLIAVYICKRRHKEQNVPRGSKTNANNSPGNHKTDADGVENCTNNKQKDDHEGVSYAVFMISDESSQNRQVACQEDTEFSDYNHLHEILDKPELENTYDLLESRGESEDNETGHYNSMRKVKPRLVTGNAYGMLFTKGKPKNKSAADVYENTSVSYEPVELQCGSVQFN